MDNDFPGCLPVFNSGVEFPIYGLLPDHEIERLCAGDSPMIDLFVGEQISESSISPLGGLISPPRKVISYGLSSAGYDIRVADEFRVFHNVNGGIVDPKNFDADMMVEKCGVEYVDIPPNSFALARTVEYFRMPRDVLSLVG